MKKTLCLLLALLLAVGLSMPALAGELPALRLGVEGGSLTLTLEDNSAARSLLSQLPLTLTFEDYNGTEKIAYLPEGLDLSDAPDSCDPDVGTLAYYAPWGNLCIFYQDFRYSQGLVPLGKLEGDMALLTATAGNFTATLGETTENHNHSTTLIAYFTRLDNTEATLDEIIAGGGPYGSLGNSWADRDVDAIASASLTVMGERVLGNTQAIAEMIQAETGGDLFSIQTSQSYPVHYDDLIEKGADENGDEARPPLKSSIANMDQYDTVFLGFPDWWYDMPMAVCHFLESYDFTGKTVIPFVTSASSGFAGSTRRMQGLLTDANLVEDGLEVRMYDVANAQATVHDWLVDLGKVRFFDEYFRESQERRYERSHPSGA